MSWGGDDVEGLVLQAVLNQRSPDSTKPAFENYAVVERSGQKQVNEGGDRRAPRGLQSESDCSTKRCRFAAAAPHSGFPQTASASVIVMMISLYHDEHQYKYHYYCFHYYTTTTTTTTTTTKGLGWSLSGSVGPAARVNGDFSPRLLDSELCDEL